MAGFVGEQQCRGQQGAPSALERPALVERAVETVPRNGRHDRVDAVIGGRGDELDAAAVGRADHTHPRIAGGVELDLGQGGHPADDGRGVAGLEVRRIEFQRSAGTVFTARIPRHHVVAGGAQCAHPDGTEVVGEDSIEDRAVEVRRTRHSEARPLQDRRRPLPRPKSLGRHEVDVDLGPVERRQQHVPRHGGTGSPRSHRIPDERVDHVADDRDLVNGGDDRRHEHRSDDRDVLQPFEWSSLHPDDRWAGNGRRGEGGGWRRRGRLRG
ncbi:MAG: hypothetical protein K0R01_3402, partial [Mycobacterium sp.]|nr:hypothetical protein [Mycobacterium sp.]